MEDEVFSYFFQCTSWLTVLVDLAIGVVAFVRLKATPSGLLIGGGFTLMALFRIVTRVVRLVMKPDTSAMDYDFDVWAMQLAALNTVSTCGTVLFMVVIAIGFFLLPKSLEKLATPATGEIVTGGRS